MNPPPAYVFLGVNPPGTSEASSAPNHSPRFFVDESALVLGVRTMCTLAVDYLSGADGGSVGLTRDAGRGSARR
jgi:amidohydrolase